MSKSNQPKKINSRFISFDIMKTYFWVCTTNVLKLKIQNFASKIAHRLVSEEWSCLEPILSEFRIRPATSLCIHPLLLKFLILGEDRRHGCHLGFDPRGISRAIWRRLTTSKREGASTIAQQLVRTLTNRREITIHRKIKEIALAILVTKHFEMDEIAKVYLNVAYYGWDMNCLSQLFEKTSLNPQNLSEYEAATIVARLKYPQPRYFQSIRNAQIQRRAKYLLALSKAKRLIPKHNYLIHINEAF